MTDDVIRQRMEHYRKRGMSQVEGWFEDYTAEVLAALLGHQLEIGVHGDIAEIGVHHGRSFLLLANAARDGERVVALDVFEEQEKNLDRSGRGDRARFEDNIDRWAPDAKVAIIQASSLDVAPGQARETFGDVRAFSIDGGHTAAITAHDLRLAEASVVPEGLVVLDDILNWHWTGVITGLVDYLRDGGTLRPFAMPGNKLVLAPSDAAAARYRSWLRSEMPYLLSRPDVEFFGTTVDDYGPDSPRMRQEAARRVTTEDQLRRRLARARKARRAAEQRVRDIESSTSWRMTALPRRLSALVRGVRS